MLAELRRGGGSFQRVVFTDNRRVMASVAERGATLRLHQSFAAAPPRVLHAVVRLFSVKSESARSAARQVVNEFLAERSPGPAAPARRRKREILPGDRPHLERLRAEFDAVNTEHFGGLLPAVPLYLSGRMRSRNGHFSRQPLEIVISRQLCSDASPGEAEHTLRHEMIHLWQHVVGLKPDHGLAFRFWARLLGVRPRARRPVRWKQE
ncbi:MAG TPA: SprT-like domain-containing protein [Longimicrobiaceae bacterium]|nr:SprT-like domain-containing protein [Longimicrobiaceae bacterium]